MKAEAGDTEGEEEMEEDSVPAPSDSEMRPPSRPLSPECCAKEAAPSSPLPPSSPADCGPWWLRLFPFFFFFTTMLFGARGTCAHPHRSKGRLVDCRHGKERAQETRTVEDLFATAFSVLRLFANRRPIHNYVCYSLRWLKWLYTIIPFVNTNIDHKLNAFSMPGELLRGRWSDLSQ